MKITWYILCAGLLIGGLSEPAFAQKRSEGKSEGKSEPVKKEESKGGISASAASYSADAPINEILIAMLLLNMGKSLLYRKNEETT